MSHEFMRENKDLNNGKKCIVIIPDRNSSKLGVFNREACLKHNFMSGSMLPYVDAARREGAGLFIMNPNANKCPKTMRPIIDSETPDDHAWNVWNRYIKPSGFTKICFVVHGQGSNLLNIIQY